MPLQLMDAHQHPYLIIIWNRCGKKQSDLGQYFANIVSKDVLGKK